MMSSHGDFEPHVEADEALLVDHYAHSLLTVGGCRGARSLHASPRTTNDAARSGMIDVRFVPPERAGGCSRPVSRVTLRTRHRHTEVLPGTHAYNEAARQGLDQQVCLAPTSRRVGGSGPSAPTGEPARWGCGWRPPRARCHSSHPPDARAPFARSGYLDRSYRRHDRTIVVCGGRDVIAWDAAPDTGWMGRP
jgi:hypothetical protein